MVKVNLEIDDEVKEYSLPESWDDVTIEEFIKIFSFDRNDLTPIELSVKVINILTGIDEETILMIDVDNFNKINETIKFTGKDVVPVNCEYVELNGEKYYLKSDFSQLTMGEVISIEILLQSADGNLFKVMDKLLCIFLRKKKENGKLETFKGEFMNRADLFKTTPISKVYNIFSFFLDGGTTSEDNTKDFLENPPK